MSNLTVVPIAVPAVLRHRYRRLYQVCLTAKLQESAASSWTALIVAGFLTSLNGLRRAAV